MSTTLASVLDELIAQEIERRQKEQPPSGDYDRGLAEGRDAGRTERAAEIAAELIRFANSLTTNNSPTPLEPAPPAPTSQPEAAPTSRSREPKSQPQRKQRVRDYLATHPGTRYAALSAALGKYVATAVYALEEAGEVVKDENRGFWLKSHAGAPHAPPNRNHH